MTYVRKARIYRDTTAITLSPFAQITQGQGEMRQYLGHDYQGISQASAARLKQYAINRLSPASFDTYERFLGGWAINIERDRFSPGVQIAYFPEQTKWRLDHEAVKFGFVVESLPADKVALCRFWRKGQPNTIDTSRENELVPLRRIAFYRHPNVDDQVVRDSLASLSI